MLLGFNSSDPTTSRTKVFEETFASTAGIDMTNSLAPGFNFYIKQWDGLGVTNTNGINVSGGILTLGAGTGRTRIVTGTYLSGSPFWVGNAWTGGYIEVRMKFIPGGTATANGAPGIFGFTKEYIVGNTVDATAYQWPGQAAGYTHFAEVDIFELAGVSATTYQATIHDWSGTAVAGSFPYNIYNSNFLIGGVAAAYDSQFHTYGWLWVPQGNGRPGYCVWYFDGTPVSTQYWTGPVGSPPLPGQGSAFGGATEINQSINLGRTFAVIDGQSLALQLQGDPSWTSQFDYVRVWQ